MRRFPVDVSYELDKVSTRTPPPGLAPGEHTCDYPSRVRHGRRVLNANLPAASDRSGFSLSLLLRPVRPAPAVARIAQRVFLAAPAGADGHHEAVRFHDTAAGRLDAHRTGHQDRTVGHHLNPGGSHDLSARITTISSSRQPRGTRPVSSSHAARADNTGPNGIH